MSLASLEIGRKALLAQRMGLDITSNNIANVNTEGYSRRDAQYIQTDPLYQYGNFHGTGALMGKLRTFREEFFDREVRNTFSRKYGLEQDDKILERIETILAEPTDQNLNNSVTDFFKAFDELALKPESVGLRENVLEVANTFVDKFNYLSRQLSDARTETGEEIYAMTEKANRIITEIASLNESFSSNKSMAYEQAQTMIDRRETLLEELSEISNVNVTENEDGTINTYINGINVVTKHVPSILKVQETVSNSGELTFKLTKVDKKGNFLNFVNPTSGRLSAALQHFNVTLDGRESTNQFSAFKRLNDYASAIVENVNAISNTGFGLDDTNPTSPARNFFEIGDETNTSFSLRLSDDVAENPRDIPLSSAVNEPGNSDNARAIARLADKNDFIGNETYYEYYAAFIGKVGSTRQDTIRLYDNVAVVSEQLENQRESLIGVNLDEEAVNLVKFQQAFQAASRIVNTTNEILTTIVNLGR